MEKENAFSVLGEDQHTALLLCRGSCPTEGRISDRKHG